MIRKLGFAGAAALVALSGLAATARLAVAGKPIITAVGEVHCTGLNGKVKINPPLTNVNLVPSNLTGKIKGTCTGTTESGVTPTAGKATVSSPGSQPGTCGRLVETGVNPFTVTIQWKASGGKINPTTIVFPNQSPEGAGYGLHNGVVTGSYADTGNADAQADVDLAAIAKAFATQCDPIPPKNKAPKGIKKIAILSGTLDIG